MNHLSHSSHLNHSNNLSYVKNTTFFKKGAKKSAVFLSLSLLWGNFVWAGGLSSIPPISLASPVMVASANKQSHDSLTHVDTQGNQDAQAFVDSIQVVKDMYVEEVPDDRIFENAMRGMLEKLDPHSSYLDEKEYQELKNTTAGEFYGIGLEIIMKKNLIFVVTPIDDSPAEKAGILPGDCIVKIDNTAVMGLSIDEAVDLMRGKPGTSVNLVIAREGKKDPIKFSITREPIELNSVKGELLENQYAYIRVSSFQAETAKTLEALLTKLAKQSSSGKLKGVILDLRNNPGGLLDAAVDVSDIFLDVNKVGYDKTIVTTKGRGPGTDSIAKVSTPDHTHGVPLVVLINHGTASAAEIVAAALQDDNRAVLVGTRTFGKGSVQTIIPLLDGKTAVKLTTARYYTPKGTAIQAVGVAPDVPVDQVTVHEVKEENSFIDSENSLPGRLISEQKKTPESAANQVNLDANNEEEKKLVKKDFQLYQALMLIKGTVSLEQ